MSLIYTLDFESEEAKSIFETQVDVSTSTASGSASFQQKVLKAAEDTSLSIQGFCSGVSSAPNIFIQGQETDSTTGKIDRKDSAVDSLIDYFNYFEDHVRADNTPVIYSFEDLDIYTCANAPTAPRIDLTQFNDAIIDASVIDDELDDRLSAANYMNEVAKSWNPSATQPQIDGIISELKSVSVKLKKLVSSIQSLEVVDPVVPIMVADLPNIPEYWVTRQLTEVPGFPTDAKVIDALGAASYVAEFEIPKLPPGAPLSIYVKYHFEEWMFFSPLSSRLPIGERRRVDGSITASIVRSDNTSVILFPTENFSGTGGKDREFTKILAVDESFRSIRINFEAFSGKVAFKLDMKA